LFQGLHPPARPSENLYPLITMGAPLTANPDLVRKQISIFRKGTACGWDELRAQHLTDALSVSSQDKTLIEAFTGLVNLNLSGKVLNSNQEPSNFAKGQSRESNTTHAIGYK
jgi:hypothetical protein